MSVYTKNQKMLPNLVISPAIRAKLSTKHRVEEHEVIECFLNREGGYLQDTREEHLTDPPTDWFVAETNAGRLLKVMFILRDGNIVIKSAYDANDAVSKIYDKLAK